MTEEKTRAFICIDMPDEIIKEVTRVQELLQNKKFTGKVTEPENLHLTLKFLGEITPGQLKKVQKAIKKIKITPFRVKLLKIGTFNYRKSPRIVWVSLGGREIFEIQAEIDQALAEMFPKEERFMSHLTIARVKYVADKTGFINHIKTIKPKPIIFPVSSFKLKSSELKPLGSVYTTIEEYDLE